MLQNMIGKFKSYHTEVEKATNTNPKKIIFFRDGVPEGQFRQVLDTGTLSSLVGLSTVTYYHIC